MGDFCCRIVRYQIIGNHQFTCQAFGLPFGITKNRCFFGETAR
nr:MAG TPA: hypothetical protein [Caudoviricetes sp.]